MERGCGMGLDVSRGPWGSGAAVPGALALALALALASPGGGAGVGRVALGLGGHCPRGLGNVPGGERVRGFDGT